MTFEEKMTNFSRKKRKKVQKRRGSDIRGRGLGEFAGHRAGNKDKKKGADLISAAGEKGPKGPQFLFEFEEAVPLRDKVEVSACGPGEDFDRDFGLEGGVGLDGLEGEGEEGGLFESEFEVGVELFGPESHLREVVLREKSRFGCFAEEELVGRLGGAVREVGFEQRTHEGKHSGRSSEWKDH